MISVFASSVGAEELREVADSLTAQWLGTGPKVAAFEAAFAARLGLRGFAMTNSGSNSLYLAVKVLELPAGTEVILPSFTWVACAHAVVMCGCVPVFCDVDLATHNVTADTIAPHITPRTGAIMVVHYAGKPVDMAPVLALGLPVIEDAAHAVDSSWRGVACGAIGDVGVYSFDPVKNLASPDGGGLTARDADRIGHARSLRYCGIAKSGFEASAGLGRWWEHDIRGITPKALPNDISAAIALAQLAKIDQLQATRRRIWERYQDALGARDWLVRPVDAETDERHSYFTYLVRLRSAGVRDRFARFLYERGIYTTLRYQPLHVTRPYATGKTLAVSEHLNEHGLNLPIHPRLTDGDVDQVLSAIDAFHALRS